MAQTKFQKAYSKLTPKQKQSDAMKMYLSGRKKASGRPHLAKNTREPGGYATGGRVAKAHGGSVSSRLSKAGPVGKPN